MEDILVPIVIVLGLPWIIFHYITKWKSIATLTRDDEQLLDDMNDLARRLDDRLVTIERIMSVENPNWRSVGVDPASIGIEDHDLRGHSDSRPEDRDRRAPVRRIGQ